MITKRDGSVYSKILDSYLLYSKNKYKKNDIDKNLKYIYIIFRLNDNDGGVLYKITLIPDNLYDYTGCQQVYFYKNYKIITSGNENEISYLMKNLSLKDPEEICEKHDPKMINYELVNSTFIIKQNSLVQLMYPNEELERIMKENGINIIK
ncbi:hypothetical protein ETU09_02825 [Apibacter muscae]|uniref:Uncharacterized protein n=1 Tax=Apibacter muscae TaxID=2509004 RepID=A0A563DHV3_9FLAO|nr:hypothetical protein [Apibacter muscae]TWP29394.1 hypothetical protein ETU09_02825 [Apibacter muscae]